MRIQPVPRGVPRPRRRAHGRARVARAARRPRDAGRRVREARRRRAGLPARVRRARRAVGRFSFVGRNPSATLVLRDGVVELDGPLPAGIPTDQGMLAALEAMLARYTRPSFPDLPPLHGGIIGYLGYDVVREVEHLPDTPTDDRGYPDAVMSVIGSLAAFDHWRQRVYLIESVPTLGLDADRARRGLRRRGRAGARGRRRSGRAHSPYTPVEPPSADDELPELHSSMPGGLYQRGGRGRQGAHPRRRHLPGRAGPALRPRTRRRPVRRLPGAAPGEPAPVHVLRAPSRADARRVVARADGAAARPQGDLAAHRRHPPPRAHRRGRPPHGRRAASSTRRSVPSTSCSSTSPATTSAGSPSSARSTSTS